MVALPKTILTVLLAALLSVAPVAASNATACGKLVIRAALNEGFATAHKNCTEADHALVQTAVYAAFEALDMEGTRRGLRAKRKLSHTNCAAYCDGLSRITCINTDYTQHLNCDSWASINCPGGWCRRNLAQPKPVPYIVVDDIFDNDDNDGDAPVVVHGGGSDGRRELTTGAITSCVSELECIEKKALLYSTVLSLLGNVATECANLMLSPNVLHCLMVMDD
jgi:hypothetical protein